MCIDFVTAAVQVIQTEQVRTVSIPLKVGRIDLQNIALATKCDSNLIFLGQLREGRIFFYNNPASMTLMKDEEIIAQAKRSRNFFVLDLATPGKVIRVSHTISTCFINNTSPPAHRNLALRERGQLTHLVSKNRKIRIWHCRLGHVSNAKVIRASILVDSIDLQQAKYNLSKVFIDSEKSEHDTDEDNNSDEQENSDRSLALALQTSALDPTLETSAIDPDFKKLCITCVVRKSTRTVKRHKSMTLANEKLEEVHADLWGPYNPPSQSGNTYAAILMCEHTRKTWTLYLRTKDEFVDVFQVWLP